MKQKSLIEKNKENLEEKYSIAQEFVELKTRNASSPIQTFLVSQNEKRLKIQQISADL